MVVDYFERTPEQYSLYFRERYFGIYNQIKLPCKNKKRNVIKLSFLFLFLKTTTIFVISHKYKLSKKGLALQLS